MKYILALDQGTTSSRAIVFDSSGHTIAKAQREFRQIYPHPGWMEHDALEIWDSQYAVAIEALRAHQISPKQVVAIGITNQRETTIIWDRRTGIPIANAIVWQDRRTSSVCEAHIKDGYAELVLKKTGLKIDPYFSATKIAWLLDSIPGARESANRGELAFGTVDSWLVWCMTEGKVHATDVTNASRTMLFNINLGDWDDELLTLFTIPRQILPVVHPSRSMYGYASAELAGIPICALAGDQQAALFGQVCTKPGMVKNTYGTGCFLLMNIGSEPLLSKNNLITSLVCQTDKEFTYGLEGSVFIAGAAVQWLRDGLGIINSSADVEPLARTVNDNGGVFMVPAFSGLGAPYWDPLARGVISGITGGVTAGHIARATLEAIAFQTADIVRAMEQDSGQSLVELRVDGGASINELLMQFQADVLDVPVLSPVITETTALGVAYLAGLEAGVWKSHQELSSLWQLGRKYIPQMASSQRSNLLEGWRTAVAKARLRSVGL